MSEASSSIRVAIEDSIAILTLDRPERLNAWTTAMVGEVKAALVRFEADPKVRAIVLTGAGDRAFCAGQDLNETTAIADGEAAARWAAGWGDFYAAIRGLSKPLVAALNGVAAGSGFQVALQADVRVAHEGVRMGQPEINAGVASTLGPWLMVERLGWSRTVELVLTGRIMDAGECQRIGLIHHLVPRDQVLDAAKEIARTLAAKPGIAVALNKRRLRELTEPAFAEARVANLAHQRFSYDAGEPQARMREFLAKRGGPRKDG